MEESIDRIKQAICDKFKMGESNDEYTILICSLQPLKTIASKEEYGKLRKLILQFSVNSNILALRLIYDKYVKGTI